MKNYFFHESKMAGVSRIFFLGLDSVQVGFISSIPIIKIHGLDHNNDYVLDMITEREREVVVKDHVSGTMSCLANDCCVDIFL